MRLNIGSSYLLLFSIKIIRHLCNLEVQIGWEDRIESEGSLPGCGEILGAAVLYVRILRIEMRHGYVLPKISHKEENIRDQWGPRKIRVCMRRAGKDLGPSDFTDLLAVWFSTRMKWTAQKTQSVVRKMEMTKNSKLEHITSQPWQATGTNREYCPRPKGL
jgi:hypothetical protein